MALNDIFFEERKIIRREEALVPSSKFIPQRLPCREDQLRKLGILFRDILTTAGAVYVRCVLVGPVGTGKTIVSQYFGREIEKAAIKYGINLKYIHINCPNSPSLFKIMKKIAESLGLSVPKRGLSAQEIMHHVWETLLEQNRFIIVALDDADHLIKKNKAESREIFYNLLRISDEYFDTKQYVHYIIIVKEISTLYSFDESITSMLLHNIIRFPPYSSKEIWEILAERVYEEKAVAENSVSEEIISFISDYIGYDKGGTGNARHALEILYLACKNAEMRGATRVDIHDVRRAASRVCLTLSVDDIRGLTLHELLLLLAIARIFRYSDIEFVKIGDVEKMYHLVCEEFNEKPRGHTQVWEYVKRLKNMRLINAHLSGAGIRGKTTLISLVYPPEDLENIIIEYLRNMQLYEDL
ncbi:MAG: cell division control protein Cdc6 [Thermoprotei archaeon]|nr:MAG: cell division control protein Cdc6 [Thermoprotei archaeon]